MADYNVNMKQWNGTSFDNVLPLAYNAKQLGGQSLAEVKQWVQDNNLLLYTGWYMGTGVYPVSITFPFKPILLLCPSITPKSNGVTYQSPMINLSFIDTSPVIFTALDSNAATYTFSTYKSVDDKTVNFGSKFNDSGFIYHFVAIGGYDMGR